MAEADYKRSRPSTTTADQRAQMNYNELPQFHEKEEDNRQTLDAHARMAEADYKRYHPSTVTADEQNRHEFIQFLDKELLQLYRKELREETQDTA